MGVWLVVSFVCIYENKSLPANDPVGPQVPGKSVLAVAHAKQYSVELIEFNAFAGSSKVAVKFVFFFVKFTFIYLFDTSFYG